MKRRTVSLLYNLQPFAVFAASEAWREASVGGVGGTLVPLVGSDSCCDTCHVLLQT